MFRKFANSSFRINLNGYHKIRFFWQIKAEIELVLKGMYIFHLQDFVIGIHRKSTNFDEKTVFVELFTFFLFFIIFFQYRNGK